MKPRDLLAVAEVLLRSTRGPPSIASRGRALSSVYYAVFHKLAYECANLLIGGAGAERSSGAWRQVYRALDHNEARQRCSNTAIMSRFSQPVRDFADLFVTLQEKRHLADYDPNIRFAKSDVAAEIAKARQIMQEFSQVSIKHRRAFCAHVLFKQRSDQTGNRPARR